MNDIITLTKEQLITICSMFHTQGIDDSIHTSSPGMNNSDIEDILNVQLPILLSSKDEQDEFLNNAALSDQ